MVIIGECCICQENLNLRNQTISVLHCGHLFHCGCLQRWMKTSKTCPNCRKDSKGRLVQRLYPDLSGVQTSDQVGCEDTLSLALQQNEKLNADVKALNKALSASKVDLQGSNRGILRLKDKLAEMEEELAQNDDENEDLRLELEEITLENHSLQKTIANQKKYELVLTKQLDTQKAQLQKSNKKVKQLNLDLQKEKKACRNWQNEVERTEYIIGEMDSERNYLNKLYSAELAKKKESFYGFVCRWLVPILLGVIIYKEINKKLYNNDKLAKQNDNFYGFAHCLVAGFFPILKVV